MFRANYCYNQLMKEILALLADWANGIFAVVLASYITNTEIVWWYFIIGILFAMCPDLDAFPELIKRGKIAASAEYPSDHREGLHYPIVFILIGGIFIYLYPFLGWMFLFAIMLHYINDLYGTGWGIPLLWPLTNRRYKLLGRRVNRMKSILIQDGDWDNLSDPERRLRFMVSWKKDELTPYIQKWGVENWIKKYYLNINWISGIEYGLFIFAIILLIINLT